MALHGSTQRGILAQGQVYAKPIVLGGIITQQFAQMALVDDDQVVQAIPSDRSDQALNVGVLPLLTRCHWSIAKPHGVQPLLEGLAKGAITISHMMARRPVPGKGLRDLMRDSFRCRMRGHADMGKPPPPVMQDNEAKQHPKCDRRNDEKIDGGDCLGVIVQKGPPGLRWRTTSPRHVLRHRRLGDIDPEFEQLTMNARRSPQRIGAADLADQVLHVFGYAKSAHTASGLPAPYSSEATSVPTHDSIRLNDRDRIQDAMP
jgi:hypothetical protein